MPLRITVVSDLLGADPEQPALITDQLTVAELLREIQMEFALAPANYQLSVARTGATLAAEPTLVAQQVIDDDRLLLEIADEAPVTSLTYALLRSEDGHEFPIIRSSASIGRPNRQRSITPDIDLSDLDLEQSVSRPHARIYRENSVYFVESQKPDNPVIVNDLPVTPGSPRRLQDQDWLVLGSVTLQFILRTTAGVS